MDNIFSQPIDVLEFTIRTTNVLKSENIMCIGDLVQRSEIELQRTPNLGKRALIEIKETFEALNLSFGMAPPSATMNEAIASRLRPAKTQKVLRYVCLKKHEHHSAAAAAKCNGSTANSVKPGYLTTQQARDIFWRHELTMSNHTIKELANASLVRSYRSHAGKTARWFVNKSDVLQLVRRAEKLRNSARLAQVDA